MSDSLTKIQRSRLMSRVRWRGNKETELVLKELLRRYHIKNWRRHLRIFGKPDFAFPKSRLALFVDGCFWHSCPRHTRFPKSNRLFWRRKLLANKKRDRLVNQTLRRKGWRVVRIWEHELSRNNEARLLRRLQRSLGLSSLKK